MFLFNQFKQLSLAEKTNLIRAIVMGANDGITSIAAIVLGVAGATNHPFAIFISGLAGTLAGMVSMASGEYVSVHAQNDAQVRAVMEQKSALVNHYQDEFDFVKNKYINNGISIQLATRATHEMMSQNALATMLHEKFGFNEDHEINATAAAVASMFSFPLGALLPIFAITALPSNIHIAATFIAVLIALTVTGFIASKLGQSPVAKAILRNVLSGFFSMSIAYAVGLFISSIH